MTPSTESVKKAEEVIQSVCSYVLLENSAGHIVSKIEPIWIAHICKVLSTSYADGWNAGIEEAAKLMELPVTVVFGNSYQVTSVRDRVAAKDIRSLKRHAE